MRFIQPWQTVDQHWTPPPVKAESKRPPVLIKISGASRCCHLLKRQEDSASYMERPRVVDDDDWIGMGRMDYQLQEDCGLANPAPVTMARGG
ncbi:hypothetical protein N7516_001222 [Penicillium verrucosum]|uniref:uncharacterized protein n=1 Tax=Penicillium verrucosum TaxID=60171 RepID=UPI002545A819|nr:uncharacterized protein N7516_001222 [Penicillium verrucosum]KAJ5941054.1 hypothetical protein N7516_001222 [Penicillium verrucosum]